MIDDFEHRLLAEVREEKMIFDPHADSRQRGGISYDMVNEDDFYHDRLNGKMVYETISSTCYIIVGYARLRVDGYYQHVNIAVMRHVDDGSLTARKADEFLSTFRITSAEEQAERQKRKNKYK